ncbi:tetratricopeptide repeat protein, partial [Streptomyces fulvoviolaceus]
LEVVLRILNNVRAWAAARPERSDVALWAVELSLLLPSHPARLRYERAQLLVQRGDFLTGAAELEAYAEIVAALDEAAAARMRQQAHAARAMLN